MLLIPFTRHKTLIRSKILRQYLIFLINNSTWKKIPQISKKCSKKKPEHF